jgi:DNA-directed RNA polymerase subunit RPC12/RpoP
MTEEAIPVREVPTDPIRCPNCKNRNLTLEGNITRGFVERWHDGQVVEQKFAESLEVETASIECHDCQIRFFIMTEEEDRLLQDLELEQHMFDLLLPEVAVVQKKLPS